MATLVQNARKISALTEKPELVRRVRARERRKNREKERISATDQANQNIRSKKLLGGGILRPSARYALQKQKKGGVSLKKNVVTAAATVFIISSTVWLYIMQIPFAVLSIISLGALSGIGKNWWSNILETVTFGGFSELGLVFFFTGVIGAFICGMVTMMIAIFIYSVRGVNVFSGTKLLTMPLVMVGYLFPIFNLFPLVWIWCLFGRK